MTKNEPNTETTAAPLKTGPLNVYKYRWIYIGISILFLIPGIYFIIHNLMDPEIKAPVRLGIDFRGGTLLEYGFSKEVKQADVANIRAVFDEHGYTGSIIQIQAPRVGINQEPDQIGAESQPETGVDDAKVSLQGARQTPAPMTQKGDEPADTVNTGSGIKSIVSIRSKHIQGHDDAAILKNLEAQYGPITLLQKNSIGPALASELLGNGLLALLLAYILIVGYLTFRFQFDFAICAMIALAHDTLFLFGMFAMFGQLFHTELDSLFITALLTVVGFSVHDTIVVFDRIRENNRLYFTKKVPFIDIVNMSVNQTLARSINTSLTALLTMLALYLWGGDTTRDFVLAIIIGIAAGTYSSIFNASVLLAMWRNRSAAAVAA